MNTTDPAESMKDPGLGLTSATGLVIGSVVGTGVFTMPAVLAGAGMMSMGPDDTKANITSLMTVNKNDFDNKIENLSR